MALGKEDLFPHLKSRDNDRTFQCYKDFYLHVTTMVKRYSNCFVYMNSLVKYLNSELAHNKHAICVPYHHFLFSAKQSRPRLIELKET